MSYIEETLSKNETIGEIFAHHWSAKIPIVLWATIGIAIVIGPIIALFLWLKLKNLEQGVTSKRVIKKSGIISRTTDEMKIASIETVEIHQGILGRIFGYGSVKITGRGISDVIFENIDSPLDVKRAIEDIEPITA